MGALDAKASGYTEQRPPAWPKDVPLVTRHPSLVTLIFMSTQRPKKSREERLPRGVIIIALLLWIGAFFTAGIALVPTATLAQFGLPRSLLLVGGLALAVLGYGLIRLRRWAWIAAILFVFVNGYSLLLYALDGTSEFAGLLVLIAVIVYLLQPRIRTRFLNNAARR